MAGWIQPPKYVEPLRAVAIEGWEERLSLGGGMFVVHFGAQDQRGSFGVAYSEFDQSCRFFDWILFDRDEFEGALQTWVGQPIWIADPWSVKSLIDAIAVRLGMQPCRDVFDAESKPVAQSALAQELATWLLPPPTA